MRSALSLSLLLITHDPRRHRGNRRSCSRSCTPGASSKQDPCGRSCATTQHPYTRGLLASTPGGGPGHRLHANRRIGAAVGSLPTGCAFNPRCPDRFEPCTIEPPPDYGRRARPDGEVLSAYAFCGSGGAGAASPTRRSGPSDHDRRPRRRGVAPREALHARCGTVPRGHACRCGRPTSASASRPARHSDWSAESGSGKTTTGRCLLRLIEPSSGEVRFRGENVLGFRAAACARPRREMQIVFQDPYSSLNPRMRARQIVEEPLIIHKLARAPSAARRVAELFGLVRAQPGASGSLPAPVQRRPAPADRSRARARAKPVVRHPRRAGVGGSTSRFRHRSSTC